MTKQNDDFQKKLLAIFRVEAGEHLQVMSAGLVDLEKNPTEVQYAEIIETVFREAHSLKGAARAVNLKEIESVCQSLESVFMAVKSKNLAVSPLLFDLMQEAIDGLGTLLTAESEAIAVAGGPAIAALTQRLADALQGRPSQSAPAPSATSQRTSSVQQASIAHFSDAPTETDVAVAAHTSSPALGLSSGTVRVSTQKLDTVMRQVEELLVPRLASTQRTRELHEIIGSFASRKKQHSRIRPTLRLIERYVEKGRQGKWCDRRIARIPDSGNSETRTAQVDGISRGSTSVHENAGRAIITLEQTCCARWPHSSRHDRQPSA